MTVTEKINLKQLYEIDDNLWLEETGELLKTATLSFELPTQQIAQ
jgi:hypothetical protein